MRCHADYNAGKRQLTITLDETDQDASLVFLNMVFALQSGKIPAHVREHMSGRYKKELARLAQAIHEAIDEWRGDPEFAPVRPSNN